MVLSIEACISEELGCPSLPAQECAHHVGISPNPVIYGCLQRFPVKDFPALGAWSLNPWAAKKMNHVMVNFMYQLDGSKGCPDIW